jgi:hypothetical protein
VQEKKVQFEVVVRSPSSALRRSVHESSSVGGCLDDMTVLVSRSSNELIGRKNAFHGETPRLQSQRTRNHTERAVAVRQIGRIIVVGPTVAAAFAESTGKPLNELKREHHLNSPSLVAVAIAITEHRPWRSADTSNALSRRREWN